MKINENIVNLWYCKGNDVYLNHDFNQKLKKRTYIYISYFDKNKIF